MLAIIEILQECIYSLGVALLLVYLSQLAKRSLFFSSLVFLLLLFGVNIIEIYRDSSLVEILRGIIGDVSLSSGMLLLLIVVNQFNFKAHKSAVLNHGEKLGLIIIGSSLYLSTFGFISADIYHLGYLQPVMLLLVASVIIGLIIFNRRLGYVWLVALIGFYGHWQFSNNLWDYLYDPLLWLVLLIGELRQCVRCE